MRTLDGPTERRGARLIASLVALLFIVAACGGGGDDDAAVPADAGDAAGAGGEGLTLEDELVCDQALFEAARTEGTMTIYTTTTQEPANAIADAFTEDTGIEVEVFRAPGSELLQRALAEADGGVHAFDVFANTAPDNMDVLVNEGLLTPHEVEADPERILVPEEIDPEYYYYPLYAWLYVPAYNSGVVDDENAIETWEDVLSPAYHGSLGITPAGVGGTGVAQAAFQKEVLGEDFWARLGQADPVMFSTTATVGESLARGELKAAILAESVAARYVADGAPVEMVYPEQGIIGGVSYQGVATNAPHPNAAQCYQNWTLSKRGQDVIATRAASRPIRDDAADAQMEGADLPPQDEINIWWSNLRERMATRDQLVAAWNEAVGYTE